MPPYLNIPILQYSGNKPVAVWLMKTSKLWMFKNTLVGDVILTEVHRLLHATVYYSHRHRCYDLQYSTLTSRLTVHLAILQQRHVKRCAIHVWGQCRIHICGNVAFTQKGNDTSEFQHTHFIDGQRLALYIGRRHPPISSQNSCSSSVIICRIQCPVFSCFVPPLIRLATLNPRAPDAHILYPDLVSPRAEDDRSEFSIWEHSAPLRLTPRSATSRSVTSRMPLSQHSTIPPWWLWLATFEATQSRTLPHHFL